MKTSILFCLSFVFAIASHAQKNVSVQVIANNPNTSLRGMSVPSDQVIWVSGNNGTVGKSIDGGATWRWHTIKGYETRDFRDIEAFDSTTAIIMAVDNPAYILKTTDGGFTWKKVFEKNQNGMFLDAMDFKNEKEGICIGDPLQIGSSGRGFFYIIRTFDGGETWQETPLNQLPPAQTGEAIFSASGTNISFLDHPDFEYAFVTGGTISNIFMMGRPGKPNKAVTMPIVQGKESNGAFSFDTDRNNRFYVIGGDYKVPRDYFDIFFFTTDAGKKWGSPSIGSPFGYRSCIRIINDKMMVACGVTGVDFATNAHKEWQKASLESFNVAMVSKTGKAVFLAGDKGKIGKLIY
ncbi:WD40/YVTN/BNR-like repeat-containing protein [Aridibaculum aurantiacum]|uniref:WD40/YVTN/BNR-like repeat-containing protein n=1 Tax=Aridibaculum aurantiacum TaxID=2810307 RepID=UPI001A97B848|nr:oxidoreductase [Aridibaculum aurantiacum]